MIQGKDLSYVFTPPILKPAEMANATLVMQLQEHANEMNVRRGLSPLFPFRWVMRENANTKKLVHVSSNWVDSLGTILSNKGARKYIQAIWKYAKNSFSAVLHEYNLSSRIMTPSDKVVRRQA